MKLLPQVLFWLGIISIPLAWLDMVLRARIGTHEARPWRCCRSCIKSGPARSSCRAAGNLGGYLASNASGIELYR